MTWRCAWCGTPHEDDDPPCDSCGYNSFERDDPDTATGTVDTGPTYVWRCPSCGRDHVRNTPPCSRCGNPSLEKVEQTYGKVEEDLDVPSWFDVAKPYAPILIVLAVVVGLFATGIVPLSMLPGVGPPTPPDVPGDGEEVAGIDLEQTTIDVHDRLEVDRQSAESRIYDDDLAAYATYENRRLIANEFTDESHDQRQPSDFGVSCTADPVEIVITPNAPSFSDYDDEADLAAAIAVELQSSPVRDAVESGYDAEGLDVHVAPDGAIVVYYVTC